MSQHAAERYRLISEIAAAYAERAPEAAIVEALGRLEAHLRPVVRRSLPRRLPRRVANAFALALHAQPHLAATWGAVSRAGTAAIEAGPAWPVEAPLLPGSELVERTLSLAAWELDDLREEIDRRAGRELKQARALTWMWARFGVDAEGSTWSLFRVLFPGVGSQVAEVDLVRHGARLYALVGADARPEDTRGPPLAALYLPWLPHDDGRDLYPLTTFRSRSVDKGLRRALARGVGADEPEVDALLESMVCLVPHERAAAFLTADLWRSAGPATLADLGASYTDAVWLSRPPRDGELTWNRWLRAEAGRLRVADEPRMLFDTLASRRVEAMMRQVYAALLASLHPGRAEGAALSPADVPLFDVRAHLAAVIGPLLAWPRDPDVHQQIASALDLPLEHVAERLLELGDTWEAQATTTWLALPSGSRPHTVPGILLQHLVALFASVRRLAWEPPDPRGDHRPTLLLFAAHYLREARLERLWLRGLSDSVFEDDSPVPPPEDVVGTWFWGCWTRLLEAVDAEATHVYASIVP